MHLSLIQEGEELEKKATRGPWSFERNVRMETYNIESAVPSEYVVWKGYESDGGVCFKEDAEFIVWLKNNAKELLEAAKQVETLKEENRELKEQLAFYGV